MEDQTTRFLQGASVFGAYIIVYVGVTVIGAFLLWRLAFVYLLWVLCCDRKTYNCGGRRVEWIRRLAVFKYISDYFPVSLIKTAELDPSRNYIFGYHPHGIIPDGLIVSFGSEALQFSKMFPGVVPHIAAHSYLGWSPLFRDLAMALGCVDVSRESCQFVLTQLGPGHSIAIVIGGASELLGSFPRTYALTLSRRKGFVRLALQTGSPLVPVFGFGRNDIFEQPKVQFLRSYNTGRSKFEKWGKVILKNIAHRPFARFGVMPYRRPITVIVGSPIPVEKVQNPSEQQIDELHFKYVEQLKKLFEEHRHACGVPKDTELVIQ